MTSSKADTMFKKAFLNQLRHHADLLGTKLGKRRGFQGVAIGVLPEFADAQPPLGWYIAVYADPKCVAELTKVTDRNVRVLSGQREPIDVPIEVVSLTDVRVQSGSTLPVMNNRGR